MMIIIFGEQPPVYAIAAQRPVNPPSYPATSGNHVTDNYQPGASDMFCTFRFPSLPCNEHTLPYTIPGALSISWCFFNTVPSLLINRVSSLSTINRSCQQHRSNLPDVPSIRCRFYVHNIRGPHPSFPFVSRRGQGAPTFG